MIAELIESLHLREQGYDLFGREVDQRSHFAISTAPAKPGDWEI